MGAMSNRDRLIEAAAKLLYRRGFAATSVEDVLRAARVARSNFYYHFPDKLALARDVVRHWIGVYDRELVAPALDHKSLPPSGRLERLFLLAERTQDPAAGLVGCPLGGLALELSQFDETLRRDLSGYFRQLEHRLAETIAEGIRSGGLRRAGTPRRIAALAVSVLEGALLLSRTHERRGQVRRAGLALVGLLRDGAPARPTSRNSLIARSSK